MNTGTYPQRLLPSSRNVTPTDGLHWHMNLAVECTVSCVSFTPVHGSVRHSSESTDAHLLLLYMECMLYSTLVSMCVSRIFSVIVNISSTRVYYVPVVLVYEVLPHFSGGNVRSINDASTHLFA